MLNGNEDNVKETGKPEQSEAPAESSKPDERVIDEYDREYYFRDSKIDWENLSGICEAKSGHPKFQ